MRRRNLYGIGLVGTLLMSAAIALPAAAQKHGGCPPGQAKKGNCEPGESFVPPGQMKKKWRVGQPLPSNVVYYPAPVAIYGMPPPGHQYVQVDDDVLLMEQATRLIVNLVMGR